MEHEVPDLKGSRADVTTAVTMQDLLIPCGVKGSLSAGLL
jgi:hypothetical protein